MATDVEVVRAADCEAAQRRVAAALAGHGLRGGDRVAVQRPASGALLAVVLAAVRTGVVPVVLDPGLPAAEKALLVDAADPALVVDDDAGLRALLAGGDRGGPELAPFALARPMLYTFGTTGRRKGVWSGVLGEADARALHDEEVALWGFRGDDRYLLLALPHHSAPLRFAMHTLLAGGDVLLPARSTRSPRATRSPG